MRTTTIILTFLLLPLLAFNKVNFFQGSLNDVQRVAAIEGKLYFIDFYAAYCIPCKLMDETTFMDEELGSYIVGNYVPLKLNIDAFDAYEVRSQYEVKALPTVMIFSSSGKLLESYEGSLTARTLYKMLEKHNTPQNRQKTTPPPVDQSNVDMAGGAIKPRRRPNQSPQPQTEKPKPTVTIPQSPKVTKPIVITKPPKPKTVERPKPQKPIREAKPEITLTKPASNSSMKPVTPIKKPTSKRIIPQKPIIPNTITQQSKPTVVAQNPPKTKAKGLYEFSAKKHPSRGYAVQIGLFAEYGNVLVEVEKIEQLFPERKVIVHIDEFKGKTVYRVAIGTFTSYTAAKNYLPIIKEIGFDGFIKNLETLK